MNYTFDELNTIIKKIEAQGFADESCEEVRVYLTPYFKDDKPVGYTVYKVFYGVDRRLAAYTSLYTFNELNMMLGKTYRS